MSIALVVSAAEAELLLSDRNRCPLTLLALLLPFKLELEFDDVSDIELVS
jgi:hypothetical protein